MVDRSIIEQVVEALRRAGEFFDEFYAEYQAIQSALAAIEAAGEGMETTPEERAVWATFSGGPEHNWPTIRALVRDFDRALLLSQSKEAATCDWNTRRDDPSGHCRRCGCDWWRTQRRPSGCRSAEPGRAPVFTRKDSAEGKRALTKRGTP